MSRAMLLAFLLLVLIITSQFEWKQQVLSDTGPSPNVSQKQQQISNWEEAVKENVIIFSPLDQVYLQIASSVFSWIYGFLHEVIIFHIVFPFMIILYQEQNIQRLNKLVKSLQEQLLQCQSNNKTMNNNTNERIFTLETQSILED